MKKSVNNNRKATIKQEIFVIDQTLQNLPNNLKGDNYFELLINKMISLENEYKELNNGIPLKLILKDWKKDGKLSVK